MAFNSLNFLILFDKNIGKLQIHNYFSNDASKRRYVTFNFFGCCHAPNRQAVAQT
jgi:hypothetical protein